MHHAKFAGVTFIVCGNRRESFSCLGQVWVAGARCAERNAPEFALTKARRPKRFSMHDLRSQTARGLYHKRRRLSGAAAHACVIFRFICSGV
jgi:hypothetical protein